MKTYLAILFLVYSLTLSTVKAQTIDTKKSEVSFKITGGGFFNVKGTFTGMQGNFNFNDTDLENSSFDICIQTTTIDTNNEKRDTHLKSEDFFSVEQYPEICFKSTSVDTQNNAYVTTGELTMHGVTKTVSIPFTFKNNRFEGTIEINRFDYNIGKDFGPFRVGETATVTITCQVN